MFVPNDQLKQLFLRTRLLQKFSFCLCDFPFANFQTSQFIFEYDKSSLFTACMFNPHSHLTAAFAITDIALFELLGLLENVSKLIYYFVRFKVDGIT